MVLDKNTTIVIVAITVLIAIGLVVGGYVFGGENVETPEDAAETAQDVGDIAGDISGTLEDIDSTLGG